MNYVKELNAFREYLLEHELPAGAISLWYALMSNNNKARWKQQFNGPNAVVGQLAGLSKQGVADAREKLLEHGLIRYEKGCPGKAPVYEMISLVPEQTVGAGFVSANKGDVLDPASKETNHDESQMPAMTVVDLAEQVAAMLAPWIEGRASEKQAPVMEGLSEQAEGKTEQISLREIPEKDQNTNRLNSTFYGEPFAASAPLCNEKQKQEWDAVVSPTIPQQDNLQGLFDPTLDQVADRYLTVHKRKQNKTKKRQDRTTRAQIVPVYEENIGKPTKLVQTELNEWIEKMGDGIVLEAIKRTAKHGGKTFSYVEKILREWETAQIRTVEACRHYQKQHDASRRMDTKPQKPQSPTRTIFDELREEPIF